MYGQQTSRSRLSPNCATSIRPAASCSLSPRRRTRRPRPRPLRHAQLRARRRSNGPTITQPLASSSTRPPNSMVRTTSPAPWSRVVRFARRRSWPSRRDRRVTPTGVLSIIGQSTRHVACRSTIRDVSERNKLESAAFRAAVIAQLHALIGEKPYEMLQADGRYSFKNCREAVQEVALSLIRRRSHADLGRGHKRLRRGRTA